MNDSTTNSEPPDPGAMPAEASGAQRLKQGIIFVLKLSIALGALYYVIQTKVIPNHKDEKEIIAIAPGVLTIRDSAGIERDIHPDIQTQVFISGKSARTVDGIDKPFTVEDLALGQRVKIEMNHDAVVRIEDPKAGLDKLLAMLTSPFVLLAAILAFSVQLCIGAQRLRMLLDPQGVHLSYRTALRLTYVGAFFDTFMITSVGGDAIKRHLSGAGGARNRAVSRPSACWCWTG